MASQYMLIERPIVDKIKKQASDFVTARFDSLYGVQGEVNKLGSNLTAIQAALKDAEGSFSRANSEQLKDWLKKLKEAALDAEDILETWAALRKIQRKHNPISLAIELREAAENIKKIAKRIAEISEEKENFHFDVSDSREEAWVGSTEAGHLPNTSDIFGRLDEKANIMTWLTSEESNIQGEVPVLPIIGMGGLGKTTLVQFVYNDEAVKGHFTNLIWIDVKREFELKRVGREMVECVTEMELKMTAWESIEKRIVEVLRGKKFLLVLDDLWEADHEADWGRFRQLLNNGLSGSRVLVTARIDEIVKTVRARDPLYLGCLPEEDCWSLFAKIAFGGGEPPTTEIGKIGRLIVQKCNGLPLAVTAMARMLYSCNNIQKWRSIEQDGIWKADEQNAKNGRDAILPALILSYEHLPSHLKQCFIYCHIFPKGYMFNKSELIKLWMAEGYVDSSGQGKLDQIGGNYFDVLQSRSFFQPLNIGDRERYRIHDLFHDLAASVSGNFTFHFDDKPGSIHESCRHVSFFCKDVRKPASEILKATKIRTILLPVNHRRDFTEVIEKILCTLKYLRVLDLSSSTMKEVPESIGKLKLLRYLDLSHTEIRGLPECICQLIKLQTLKLLGCVWLYELPKGFNNLSNLWHLELDEMFWNKCTSLPPGIGTLTNLQNLHSFRVGSARDSVHGVEQLQSMESLTGKLHISNLENTDTASAALACLDRKECLEELVLEWSVGSINLQDPGIQETVLEELEPHSNLKVVRICGYKGCRLPAWISNATMENLTSVSLSSCVDIKTLSIGPLPHIRKVYLTEMHNLEEWPEMDYPTLHWLQISKCPKLKTLPIFFPNLQVMKIKTCNVLKYLPVTPSLSFSTLIDNVMLENWNERIFQIQERNAEGGIREVPLPSYINLLELEIKNCHNLGGLPIYFAPQKLNISGCPLVRALPDEDYSTRLQQLALEGCNDGTLVEAIPTTSSAFSLVISNIANLISLPVSISFSLSGLKALYIHDCADLESLSNDGEALSGFTSLATLSVSGCPKLTTLANCLLPSSLVDLIINKCSKLRSFGPQNSLVALTALSDLQLKDCPEITCFPEGGLPPSLNHLSIQRCPQLSHKFNDGGSYYGMLAHIADVDIDST